MFQQFVHVVRIGGLVIGQCLNTLLWQHGLSLFHQRRQRLAIPDVGRGDFIGQRDFGSEADLLRQIARFTIERDK